MTSASSTNLWLFLELLSRRRNFIVSFVVIVTGISVIAAFVMPSWYTATALLLPPKDISTPTAGVSGLSEVASVTQGLNLPVLITPSDVFARMLRSRTIADKVIATFDLQKRYRARNMAETYDALIDHADITVTGEGLLLIQVEDKDPEIAARMANTFVDELDLVNRDIVSSRATRNRKFIETRVEQCRLTLDSARENLALFQIENRAIDFDEQMRLAIEQAVVLKTALVEIDIDLALLGENLQGENMELRRLKQRRRLISDKLALLESTNADNSFFSLPVAAMPRLRGRYEVLYSQVRVGEEVYRLLLTQLEQARIKENDKSPTISILDRAEPPDVRSRPKRTLIVASTFGFSLLFAILFAAVMDYVARMRRNNIEDYQRLLDFRSAYLGWIPGVPRGKKKTL